MRPTIHNKQNRKDQTEQNKIQRNNDRYTAKYISSDMVQTEILQIFIDRQQLIREQIHNSCKRFKPSHKRWDACQYERDRNRKYGRMRFCGNQHGQRCDEQASDVSAEGTDQIILKIRNIVDTVPVAYAGLNRTITSAEAQYS